MLDRDKFIEELKAQFNDICIVHDTEICRLIGFYEDEFDYYYHVRLLHGKDLYSSAVGHLLSLKKLLPEKEYQRMDNVFALNQCAPEAEFKISGGPDEPYITAFDQIEENDND